MLEVNWLIPIAFGAGLCFGAALTVLVAVVYTLEDPQARAHRDR